ncbi:MAG: ribonuclease H-like domain-containing protein [Acidobacteria bacterium]|nr:ribonuclease H-like domain-containing protein [Acidobacteriota bacterium]
MTSDLKQQLAVLRRRVTRISNKYRETAPAAVPASPAHYDAEAFLPGEVMENEHGRYFLSEKFFSSHRRHGTVELSRLAELPAELVSAVSSGELQPHPPRRWAFLDTETTGLAGGTGTCAFLVGVGAVEEAGFRVRLFFMRDYDEEPAMLAALAAFLANYDLLITYNGKAYDAPLLETRYRLARQRPPLDRLAHLDLLFAARRLWRLRLDSCRLVELENQILGVEREGDLPGELIPYYYFEYLRTRQAFRLVPLFHHNVMDIVTLAALTAVVLPVFAAPSQASLGHGEDLLGLARWLRQNDSHEDALALYRRAVHQGLADHNLFRALWEMALMEKKPGRLDRALEIWSDLAAVKNEFRSRALEELAKYYEHTERNYPMALEMTAAALAIEKGPSFERRRERLERKAAVGPRRLL